MEAEIREAVQAIVNYNWSDEKADFAEQDEQGRANHIFRPLSRVQAWLAESAAAGATSAACDPFTYAGPVGEDETNALGNANGYEWAYLDALRNAETALREAGTDTGAIPWPKIPAGWAPAWLEYTRRHPGSRMAIREAFAAWVDDGTLPGLT